MMRVKIGEIICCVLVLLVSQVAFAAENLIKNGGFEDGALFWEFHPAEEGAITLDNANFYSGRYSLRFEHKSSESYSRITQSIDVEPNTYYTASFWIKAEDVVLAEGGFGARLFLGRGGSATLKASSIFQGSFPWRKVIFSFNSKEESRVHVIPYLHLASGKVWFDDLEITKGRKVQEEKMIGEKTREDNIAFQRPYTLSPAPNYALTTDPGDKTQLTDGIYTVGYFWAQKSTVGWRPRNGVTITIDLGRVEPIKGISFSTAAGAAGVSWPSIIDISVSEDGVKFFPVGCLVELTEGPLPDHRKYQTFRFQTEKLRTKGRYVRLLVLSPGWFTFCDEIEIYRGPDSFLELALEEPEITEPLCKKSRLTRKGARRRFRLDVEKVKRLILASGLNSQDRKKALQETENILEQIKKCDFPGDDWEEFKAIVPFNNLHRRIFKLHAKILSNQGFPPLSIWSQHRYAPLSLFEEPTGALPYLKVTMMLNEHRSEVFNLTNASPEEMKVSFQIRGLPGGINPEYIQVYQVEYVDTREGKVVASALTELKKEDNFYITVVPSGMTRQIWLCFHPEEVKPGDYQGSIFVKSGTLTKEIPLHFSLAPIFFPERPALSFGLWDYVNTYHYEITPQNREAAIKDMKAHFVDTPWAASPTIPWPKAEDFDAQGNLIGELDFSKFDAWVKMWPKARYYMLFALVHPRSTFVGQERGSGIFNKMVSQWAAAWAKHNREIGLQPGQVGILILDEPHNEEQFKTILDWSRAIRKGTSEILIFNDPIAIRPWEIKYAQEALEYSDIICPLLGRFLKGGQEAKDFYYKLQQKGATLWFYSCAGPTRHLDPQSYFQLQAWYCFLYGATGSQFWSYGDSGGTSSWNEYPGIGEKSFTPVYLAPDSVTTSKHWKATREGIQDYQYLRMLENKVAELKKQGQANPLLTEASHLLETLPREVVDKMGKPVRWSEKKNYRSFLDEVRISILRLLIELNVEEAKCN